MPPTISLSKALYEALGEEAAKELVILLNASYESSRTDFRESLDARFASFEARFAAFEARFATFEARFAGLEARVDTKLEALKAELLRWMFLFWVGTMGTVLALLKL